MFDFHMVADRCLERYSLSSSDTIASRDRVYWVSRHQIAFLCVSREIWDWLNTVLTNSDLLQARTGTATVTQARTAAPTRRNCRGEASRPGGSGAWLLWLPSLPSLPPSWSSASPGSAMGGGSGPSPVSPQPPDLDRSLASGSLNQKMMNLPGRWELYFAIFEFLPTLLSTDGWYNFHCVIQWRILLTIGDRLCVQLLNRSVIIMLYRVTCPHSPRHRYQNMALSSWACSDWWELFDWARCRPVTPAGVTLYFVLRRGWVALCGQCEVWCEASRLCMMSFSNQLVTTSLSSPLTSCSSCRNLGWNWNTLCGCLSNSDYSDLWL